MTRRKRSILALVLCLVLAVGVLCGCNNEEDNNSTYYKLTVEDPNGYIVVDLQEQYKAGEGVRVITELIPDTSIGAYLDGVFFGLGVKTWDESGSIYNPNLRRYYFIMPEHDTVLSFSETDLTENGIPLSEGEQAEIKDAFYNKYKNKYPDLPFEQLSLRCYGAFDGVYVIFEDGVWSAFCVVTSEVIADVIFTYPDSIHMRVYCDGEFYTMTEAYEKGILSYDNLLATHKTYKACNGSTFSKDKKQPEEIELE